ncbi:hypothetical protein BDV93DRAFT_452042, partial [Ceratobasidium sp. AG-I]
MISEYRVLELFLLGQVTPVNFKQTDWDSFRSALADQLNVIGNTPIITQRDMDTRAEEIRQAIQHAVDTSTPQLRLDVHSKRWWSKELRALAEEVGHLAPRHYRLKWDAGNAIHAEFQRKRNDY